MLTLKSVVFTVVYACTDTLCHDILVVRTTKLGSTDCLLTAILLLSADNGLYGQLILATNAVVAKRSYCIIITAWTIGITDLAVDPSSVLLRDIGKGCP